MFYQVIEKLKAQSAATDSPLSVVEFAAIIYLTTPLLLFALTFLSPILSVISVVAILFVVFQAFRATTEFKFEPSSSDLVLGIAAALWLLAAGVTNIFSQSYDWPKHYAIFHALAEPWPVVRPSGLYLRYGLGFYLVPSLLEKIVGLQSAIAIWTWGGLFLALKLIQSFVGFRVRGAYITALVLIFFSGLDYIGNLITNARLLAPWHFEWWVGFGQISSVTTSLSWAPQHAVPTLLGAALVLRAGRSIKTDGLVITAIVFWSPMTAIGLIPLFSGRRLRSNWPDVFALQNILLVQSSFALRSILSPVQGLCRLPQCGTFRPFLGIDLFFSVPWNGASSLRS